MLVISEAVSAILREILTPMSRLWKYTEPTSATDPTPQLFIYSEAEILAAYYPYWSDQMRKAGKAADINDRNCIEDWIVVNWAEEVRSV